MGHQPISMNPNTTGKSSTRSSSGYHLKALAEIRNSLLPFANSGENVGSSAASTISTLSTTSGVSSASGLSGLSASSGCIDKEQLNAMGYSEENNHRALKKFDPGTSIELFAKQTESTNGLSKSSSAGLPSLNTKLMRKPSLERELCLHRGSPALDSGAGSSRSDSPHTQLSRQYSPSSFSEPPPPPPPRCSSTPPPPPPPHAPYSNAITNMQHLLKRMSPAPVVSSRPPAALPGSAGSGPNPPQRGTSPVASSTGPASCSGRQPMVVQNGPQVQQQLTQQMQALSLYQSPAPVEPPPPYPLGSSSPGPLPPPSYSASIQSRQSPTQDYRKSPSSGIYSNSNSIGSPSPITVSASATPTSGTVGVTRPTPLQAWGARQAKTQPPFIMQSVKSTQVQKPILQTAIAPTAPQPAPHGVAIPPPSYASSIQQKQQTQLPSFNMAPGKQVASVGSSSPKQPPGSPVTTTTNSISVPTTEPPSYASTMQALAMQKGMVTPSAQHMHHPLPPPPYAGDDSCRTGTGPGVINGTQVSGVDGASPRSSATPHPPLQRKFSPIMPGEPRSDSPLSVSSSESGRAPLAAYPSVNIEAIGIPTATQLPPTISTKTSSNKNNNNTGSSNNNNISSGNNNNSSSSNNDDDDDDDDNNNNSNNVNNSSGNSNSSTIAGTIMNTNNGSNINCNNNNINGNNNSSSSISSNNINNNVIIINNSNINNINNNNNINSNVTITDTPPPPGSTNSNINSNYDDDDDDDDDENNNSNDDDDDDEDNNNNSNNNNINSNSNNHCNYGNNNINSNCYNNLSSANTGMQNGNSNSSDRRPSPTSAYKVNHQSPIPERKQMSKEKEEERRDCKVRNYSPQAYKFFMEQHVENVIKNYKQRQFRRVQLESEMNKIGLNPECQSQMRKMLSQKESNYIRLKRAKMDKSMFKKMKTIGVGAFGEVALVCKIDANHLYAMKTLRKADVLKRNQVAHVKAERDILAEADNEWVVKLYYSFQDKDNLYFVMDYIPGGDLMSLLIKLGVFQESLARFYIAELTCAIESVHKMGFIHRDIKPDNILIDKDGHIKLTDFGLCTGFRWTHNSKYYQRNGEHTRQDSMDPSEDWSNECRCRQLKPLERRRRREHQRCLAHSLVGTPNYIAPEVLLRTGYTQLCDWWSVGVILYEMVVGSPPFLANTPAETQYKVINWEQTLHIPKDANLSPESTDLILKLCCGADKRLGKNASEVKAHPFFKSIDFEKGLRTQPAPYLPRIQNPMDTSNFDPVDPDKLHQSGSSDSTKSDELLDNGNPFHGFFEFTFRRFFDDGGGPAAPFRISLDDNDNPGPVYV